MDGLGGGLWELRVGSHKEGKLVKMNKRLLGVPFRESADHRHITSNAASSIEAIMKQIAAKWPGGG